MKYNKKKGFTLVELVVVIAVIAILAGVLIGTFTSVINRANQSKAVQEWKAAVDEAYVEYVAVYHTVPTTFMLKNGMPTFGGTYNAPVEDSEVYILDEKTYVTVDADHEVYLNWTGSEYYVATEKETTAATMVPADVYALMVEDYNNAGGKISNMTKYKDSNTKQCYIVSGPTTYTYASSIFTPELPALNGSNYATLSGDTFTIVTEAPSETVTLYEIGSYNGTYNTEWVYTATNVTYKFNPTTGVWTVPSV